MLCGLHGHRSLDYKGREGNRPGLVVTKAGGDACGCAACRGAGGEAERGKGAMFVRAVRRSGEGNDWKESKRFEKNGERAKHVLDLIQKFLQKMLQAIPLMFFHGLP